MIGVLGGMGPMATLDFMKKIISATPAKFDQEHLPLLVCSDSHIPDRTACILHGSKSPLPKLRDALNRLIDGGASCVAIPCNTAHHWYEDLASNSSIPIFNMVNETVLEIQKSGAHAVSVLATEGTVRSNIYNRVLETHGIENIQVPESLQAMTMDAIYYVKQGDVLLGGSILLQVVDAIRQYGAEKIVLACTEIPLALQEMQDADLDCCVDATDVLANTCVRWYQEHTC